MNIFKEYWITVIMYVTIKWFKLFTYFKGKCAKVVEQVQKYILCHKMALYKIQFYKV